MNDTEQHAGNPKDKRLPHSSSWAHFSLQKWRAFRHKPCLHPSALRTYWICSLMTWQLRIDFPCFIHLWWQLCWRTAASLINKYTTGKTLDRDGEQYSASHAGLCMMIVCQCFSSSGFHLVLNTTVIRTLTVGHKYFQSSAHPPAEKWELCFAEVDYLSKYSSTASNTLQLLMLLSCLSNMRKMSVRG